jgi:Uma2 family endonuclease
MLHKQGYYIYAHAVRIAIPNEPKFYYPDVFITKEPQTKNNEYVKYEPELIVEVLSPTTQITDRVDKYIDYTTIPSLKYYLVVEPEIVYITLYHRNEEGGWEAKVFSRKDEIIELPVWGINLPLDKIYRS